jgi:hypothetical protein
MTLIIWKLKCTLLQQHLPATINGTSSGREGESEKERKIHDLWEEENQIYLNEVDPLQTLLLNKYNTYCPFVEFIQIGNLNVSKIYS